MPYFLGIGTAVNPKEARSFIGGRPRLPAGNVIPTCVLCAAPQTFMFQVIFEEGEWRNWVIACFFCTSCAQPNHFIPEMPDPPLRGADISREFLISYQKNFRFLVFEHSTDLIEQEYNERVIFKPLVATKRKKSQTFAQMGGRPKWLLEDETPARLAGRPPVFLMNIFEDKSFGDAAFFQIEGSAPRQVELSLSGVPELSEDLCYKLFLGNSVYFFGTVGDERIIYAFTQTA